jgi:hypothetical protein
VRVLPGQPSSPLTKEEILIGLMALNRETLGQAVAEENRRLVAGELATATGQEPG